MLSKTIIILLSGKAGVGKSTTADFMCDFIEDNYTEYTSLVRSFAGELKNIARSIGWDGVKDEKGRNLLIDLGCNARKYDEAVWAKKLVEGLENHPNYPVDFVFLDDWRFPNEGKFLENQPMYRVFKVRIISPERELLKGTAAYFDQSECSLDDNPLNYDYMIYNSGTLNDLKVISQSIIKDILGKDIYF
jgi:hypothetical protein